MGNVAQSILAHFICRLERITTTCLVSILDPPEAESKARQELFEAASNYATTSEGINALLEELASERHHLDEADLFRSDEELVAEALHLQELKAAHRLRV